jgi:hypothetical protein
LGENINIIEKNTVALLDASKVVGPEVNADYRTEPLYKGSSFSS